MSNHPYGPDEGLLAVEEGRRALAVEAAVLLGKPGEPHEVTIRRAEAIEAYLKGRAGE